MQFNLSLVLLLLTGLALSQVLATSKELEASSEKKDVHDEVKDMEEDDADQDRSKKEAPPCLDNEEQLVTVEHPEEALSVPIPIEEPKPETASLPPFEDRALSIPIPVDYAEHVDPVDPVDHVEPTEEPHLQPVDTDTPVQLPEPVKIQPVVDPSVQAINLQPVIRPLPVINIQQAVQPPLQAINVQPAIRPLQAINIQPALQPPKAVNVQPAIRPLHPLNIQPPMRPPQAVNFQPIVRPPQPIHIQPALQAIHPFSYRPHILSSPPVNLQQADKSAPSASAEPSTKPVPSMNLTEARPAVSPCNSLPTMAHLANFNPIISPKYPQFDPRVDYESRRLIGVPNGDLDVENFHPQQLPPLNPAYWGPLSPLRPLPLERFYRPRTPFEVVPPYFRPPRRQCYRYWPQPRFEYPYYQRPYAGVPPADLTYDRPVRHLEFGEPPAPDSL